ncbi:hypothetical protein FOXG_12508 [Fusarium oxysporum f. sp. lycopersici 4287]|uniref:Uncharacterized protein n=1 Tax=Fusarium oxysporum f. sp. lycopersici (strain 4287 / CBS 123668 / FGSC 9935 / NRRL 34936) TaxID=426428 RepID=A0A0J9VSM8_FUSO4|nr:hypothetical protein FOXG_12508 [Fusarium oxysporum f. sp. lycopersici 4287]EWZ79272.1 hypothetical protein FOWG_16558 [Fusarium oxysporum f. sp. lycopersici MN25]KNB13858.1 hypothetical protein FOXG_12508 [Fusarium oxysporum f. sp. lycopersici 4287]
MAPVRLKLEAADSDFPNSAAIQSLQNILRTTRQVGNRDPSIDPEAPAIQSPQDRLRTTLQVGGKDPGIEPEADTHYNHLLTGSCSCGNYSCNKNRSR